MNSDQRLSLVLHALMHLVHAARPLTSEELAAHLDTNPVVLRRAMAGLRRDALVVSGRGRGGGWQLGRTPDRITLRQVHEALGSPAMLAMGLRIGNPGCLVEGAVNRALAPAFADAQARLLERLGQVTLAVLAEDVDAHAPRGAARDMFHA